MAEAEKVEIHDREGQHLFFFHLQKILKFGIDEVNDGRPGLVLVNLVSEPDRVDDGEFEIHVGLLQAMRRRLKANAFRFVIAGSRPEGRVEESFDQRRFADTWKNENRESREENGSVVAWKGNYHSPEKWPSKLM